MPICSSCLQDKNLDQFAKDTTHKSGYKCICKSCAAQKIKQWRNAHPERAKEQAKKSREKHKEQRRKDNAEWIRSHKEHLANYQAKYYQEHKEKKKRQHRLRYEANTDHVKAISLKWTREHPEQHRVNNQNRRARELNAEGAHTYDDELAQLKRQKRRCYYCHEKIKGDHWHPDHAVPLSRGGSNWPDNIVIACPRCNLSKNNKLPHEWPEGGRLL